VEVVRDERVEASGLASAGWAVWFWSVDLAMRGMTTDRFFNKVERV